MVDIIVTNRYDPRKMRNKRLCELTNPTSYNNSEWMRIHRDLETYSYDKHVFSPNIYRKGWEWTQAAYGLCELNAIAHDRTALGVGAGRECLIFWLADRIGFVVATDLYGNEVWSSGGGKEADADVTQNPQKYCPREITKNNIAFVQMDGTSLGFDDDSFDIVWSMSSIEHFGGHQQAAKSMREIARVTKKGGIIALATEYLLLSEYTHPEYFNETDLSNYIIKASGDLELIEPVELSLPPVEYLIDSVVVPNGAHRFRRHVILNDGQVQWTSVMLFLKKR